MDATTRPLRIPPEMALYAEKHDIFSLFRKLVRNMIKDRPEDPIQYLINCLKIDNFDVPRIMILGPPASGKTTIAKKLCEHTQAVYISEDDADLTGSDHQEKSQKYRKDFWIQSIRRRLSKDDCVRKGWILDAIPAKHEEALSLQEAGILPDHVVMLEAPDVDLIERTLGKRLDPVTREATECSRSPGTSMSVDVMVRKHQRYQTEAHALKRIFHSCQKTINAKQSLADVFSQALSYVLSQPHAASPYTPRIILLGPAGSGKSLQAGLIAQKYGTVNICCGELLKAVSADESHMGELIKQYLVSEQQVPTNLVMKILKERLSRLDCTTRGWVLHGFPRNVEQAKDLQDFKFLPNRVFFLDVTDDTALERVTLRGVDPKTGEWYHGVYNPAPSLEVQARLLFNPRDSKAQLQMRLEEYRANEAGLRAFYPQAVHISADQPTHTVFESVESRLVSGLPRVLPNPHTKST